MAKSVYEKSTIVLINGEEIELVPTLAAMEYLQGTVDNFQAIYGRLATLNFDMYAHVIVAGVLPKKTNIKTVKDGVFETGMTNLMEPLIRYVTILLNGGKEPKATEEAKGEEGE
jgi:hypothetical protein